MIDFSIVRIGSLEDRLWKEKKRGEGQLTMFTAFCRLIFSDFLLYCSEWSLTRAKWQMELWQWYLCSRSKTHCHMGCPVDGSAIIKCILGPRRLCLQDFNMTTINVKMSLFRLGRVAPMWGHHTWGVEAYTSETNWDDTMLPCLKQNKSMQNSQGGKSGVS